MSNKESPEAISLFEVMVYGNDTGWVTVCKHGKKLNECEEDECIIRDITNE